MIVRENLMPTQRTTVYRTIDVNNQVMIVEPRSKKMVEVITE